MRKRFQHLEQQNQLAQRRIRQAAGDGASFAQMYDISWIYHENGLEGCVLTYPEIRSAVDNQVISDVSLLPTYRDIKTQKRCIDSMRQRAAPQGPALDAAWMVEQHAHLVGDGPAAGCFRRDIPIHRTYFHPIVAPEQIPEALGEALAYGQLGPDYELHPVELGGRLHHRLMRVFPFSHHSGFLARLAMNQAVMRAGFLPVIIHAADRQRYYEALRGEEPDFVVFLAEAMANSQDNALRYLANAQPHSPRRAAY